MSGVARGQEKRTARNPLAVPDRYRGKLIRNRVRGFPEKVVALTFDDGPDPRITRQVLRILRANNAKATFFVIGSQADQHPRWVRQTLREGHVIANHTYTHRARPDVGRATVEIRWTSQAIRRITGYDPHLFRPPYGIYDGHNAKVAMRGGYATVLWTHVGQESVGERRVDRIVANLTRDVKPGSILLMHDGPGHRTTVDSLPRVLKRLQAQGYRFVTLPDLMRRWDRWEARQRSKARR